MLTYFCTPFLLAAAGDLSFSIQSGLLSGEYVGATAGVIDMPNAFDLQIQYANTSRTSISARSMMSLDAGSGIFRYLFAGLGTQLFLGSYSGPQRFDFGASRIEVTPKIQYFLGGEMGFSQMVVQQVTNSFSVQSTMVEIGGSTGVIYPLSKNMGLHGSVSILKGIGISAVAVDSTIVKVLIGFNFR